jgi:hypothetical protein
MRWPSPSPARHAAACHPVRSCPAQGRISVAGLVHLRRPSANRSLRLFRMRTKILAPPRVPQPCSQPVVPAAGGEALFPDRCQLAGGCLYRRVPARWPDNPICTSRATRSSALDTLTPSWADRRLGVEEMMHPLETQYVAAEALRSMMTDARKARMTRQARAARRRRRTRAGAYGAKPGRPAQRHIIHIKVAGVIEYLAAATARSPRPSTHRPSAASTWTSATTPAPAIGADPS